MPWIQHPLLLTGDRVILTPLDEIHFEELIEASSNNTIWTFMSFDGTNRDKLRAYLTDFIANRDKGEQYPFVVIEKIDRQDNWLHKLPENKPVIQESRDRLDMVHARILEQGLQRGVQIAAVELCL